MRPIDADRVIAQAYEEMFAYEAEQFEGFITSFPVLTLDDIAPHGRWIEAVESKLDTHTGEHWEEVYYNCSLCDYASDWKSPYCPNCGAKMDLEVNE